MVDSSFVIAGSPIHTAKSTYFLPQTGPAAIESDHAHSPPQWHFTCRVHSSAPQEFLLLFKISVPSQALSPPVQLLHKLLYSIIFALIVLFFVCFPIKVHTVLQSKSFGLSLLRQKRITECTNKICHLRNRLRNVQNKECITELINLILSPDLCITEVTKSIKE